MYVYRSTLPIAYAEDKAQRQKKSVLGYLAASSTRQLNVSKAQKELLLWYGIIGYYDIRDTQSMMSISNNAKEHIIFPQSLSTST